jgi:hypothetical protein
MATEPVETVETVILVASPMRMSAVTVLLVDGGEGEVERLALGGLRGRLFFGSGVGLGD